MKAFIQRRETIFYFLMSVSGFFTFYTFFRLMQLFAGHFIGAAALLYLVPMFLASSIAWLYSLKLVKAA